ncbi:GNAT family N-acetyltransferase [Jannaschia pohangensis]|uniref:Acetyltransferase (GNAT) family protein n=1 Tax=Jannaschia pohangensis TaxID=390807 RepID=A0A1I3QMG2_9RHOB|nr:GNAT family N-acetyltransferase [Jannaschia pohangensis]SFJ34421.1 Acetyltransferase (GNAT) family protein [Jannaschia pohangensis]
MTHIRPAVPADRSAILAVGEGSGLFSPEDLTHFIATFDGHDSAGDRLWLIAGSGDGAAFLEPEAMSDNVWNLRFIGVLAGARRGGVGRLLLAAAETAVRRAGGRLLLIDTASLPDMAPARAFYLAAGYQEEACVRDFYGDGVARVTFARRL